MYYYDYSPLLISIVDTLEITQIMEWLRNLMSHNQVPSTGTALLSLVIEVHFSALPTMRNVLTMKTYPYPSFFRY